MIEKFIRWICKKFDMGAEDNLIKDFEKETKISLYAEKQIKHEEREKIGVLKMKYYRKNFFITFMTNIKFYDILNKE